MDLAAGSYFGGRRPADGRIDWAWPAKRIYDLVRAVTHPYPGAFTSYGGRRVLLWWAMPIAGSGRSGASGTLEIDTNGAPPPGTVLASTPHELHVATGDGVLALHRCQLDGEAEADAPAVAAALGLVPGARFDPLGEPR
jgi:methionyl-tRNA formyltransferase